MATDGPSGASAQDRPDRVRDLVESYCLDQFAGEDLLAELEKLLAGLPLYPVRAIEAVASVAALRLDKSPQHAVDLTLILVSSSAREVRAAAALIMAWLARLQPGIWLDPIQHLLNDDDWEVRDLAAHCFDTPPGGAGAIDFHPDYVLQAVRDWAGDGNYLLRRAATQALLGHAAKHPDFRRRLLELLEPLLEDDLEYVRDSFAAALRTLGRADPALVLGFVEQRLDTMSDSARLTIRGVLDHSFADRLPDRKADLMRRLLG